MVRAFRPCLLVLLLASGCSEAPAPEAAAPAAAPAANPATQRQARAEHIAARVAERIRDQRPVARRWWEDPAEVEAAGLDAAQQAAISARVQRAEAEMEAAAAASRTAREAYRQALRSGDFALARQQAQAMADGVAAQTLRRQLLLVEVLEDLPPPVRERLLAEQPERLAALLRAGSARGRRARTEAAD